MTRDEAQGLYAKMLLAWPAAHLDRDTWLEELQLLDAGTAGTAFVRLRRELEHAPTVARFHAKYRSLDTKRPTQQPAGCGRNGCQDGAITVWLDHNGQTARYAYACDCPASVGYSWLGQLPDWIPASALTPPEPTTPRVELGRAQRSLDLDPTPEPTP